MCEGEGRTTPDNLDRLRQRRGKHWHGSCLCLQVELVDLEKIATDESLYMQGGGTEGESAESEVQRDHSAVN